MSVLDTTSPVTSRVAVVTGDASGMGLSVSRRLAGLGHRVAMVDLQGDAVQQAAKELSVGGGSVLACEVDVTTAAESTRRRARFATSSARSRS